MPERTSARMSSSDTVVGRAGRSARRGLEGMAVGDLEAQRRGGRRRRAAIRSALEQARAPARRAQAGAARSGARVAAERAQLGAAAPAASSSCRRERLLVHHRIGEAGLHQHVAEVVHVDEGGRRRRPAEARGTARAARAACPGRGTRTSRSRRPRAARCQRANSAGGSATACSIMLAQTSCARAGAVVRHRARPAGARAPQPRGDHHGRAARPRCARAARRRARPRRAAPSDRRRSSTLGAGAEDGSTSRATRSGCSRMIASRSAMRRATSPCSHGGVGCARQAAQRAPRPRRDRDGRAAASVGLGHGAGSILSRCHRFDALARADPPRVLRAAEPVRGVPAAGAAAASAPPAERASRRRVPRCERCALRGAGRRRASAAPACTRPPPFDATHRRASTTAFRGTG